LSIGGRTGLNAIVRVDPRTRRVGAFRFSGKVRRRISTDAGPGTERNVGVPSAVVSVPRPESGDDEVRKYGALIGIIAAIGTLIVVLIVWGSNGSDAESGACTEIPAGRVPRAIICPRNATPESSKERDCIRVSTYRDVAYWTCSD
jgi:hypothetical protein